MRSFLNNMLLTIIITLMYSLPTFANETESPIDTVGAVEVVDATIEENVRIDKARVSGSTKGEWLADVVLEISNPQNGNIGVEMLTSCYQEVDRILMGLYIDALTEANTWNQVDYKVFEFLPEDFSDGKLVEAMLDIEITGHEPGWYRLRGVYLVEKGDDSEVYSLETDGIEITDRFPLSAVEATPSEVISDEAGQ